MKRLYKKGFEVTKQQVEEFKLIAMFLGCCFMFALFFASIWLYYIINY